MAKNSLTEGIQNLLSGVETTQRIIDKLLDPNQFIHDLSKGGAFVSDNSLRSLITNQTIPCMVNVTRNNLDISVASVKKKILYK